MAGGKLMFSFQIASRRAPGFMRWQ